MTLLGFCWLLIIFIALAEAPFTSFGSLGLRLIPTRNPWICVGPRPSTRFSSDWDSAISRIFSKTKMKRSGVCPCTMHLDFEALNLRAEVYTHWAQAEEAWQAIGQQRGSQWSFPSLGESTLDGIILCWIPNSSQFNCAEEMDQKLSKHCQNKSERVTNDTTFRGMNIHWHPITSYYIHVFWRSPGPGAQGFWPSPLRPPGSTRPHALMP